MCIPFIAMAYRATPHESTGFSPNFMMHGRELSMPVDVMLSLPRGEQHTPRQYAQKLRSLHVFVYVADHPENRALEAWITHSFED